MHDRKCNMIYSVASKFAPPQPLPKPSKWLYLIEMETKPKHQGVVDAQYFSLYKKLVVCKISKTFDCNVATRMPHNNKKYRIAKEYIYNKEKITHLQKKKIVLGSHRVHVHVRVPHDLVHRRVLLCDNHSAMQ